MSIIQVENVWLYSQLAHLKTHSREKSNNVDFPGGKCLAKLSAGTQPEFQCSGAQVKFTLKKIIWLFRLLFWWFPWWYVSRILIIFHLQVFQGLPPIFLSLPTHWDVSLQTSMESSLFLVFSQYFLVIFLVFHKVQWNLTFSWYFTSRLPQVVWMFKWNCHSGGKVRYESCGKKTSQEFQILPYVTSSLHKTPNVLTLISRNLLGLFHELQNLF